MQNLITFSDINLDSLYFLSQAFEQAKRSPGPVFCTTGDIDIEKIKNSKYFQALLKQSKEKDTNPLVKFTDNHTATE